MFWVIVLIPGPDLEIFSYAVRSACVSYYERFLFFAMSLVSFSACLRDSSCLLFFIEIYLAC